MTNKDKADILQAIASIMKANEAIGTYSELEQILVSKATEIIETINPVGNE